MKAYSLIIAFLFSTTIAMAENEKKVTHKHGSRSHSHVLPKPAGLAHFHNQKVPSKKTIQQATTHYHGERKHDHPLPLIGYAHKHGNSDVGTVKQTSKVTVTPTKVVSEAPTTTTSITRFRCSDISRSTAKTLLDMGHGYLDRDNDGDPCEPHNFPEQKPYTPAVSASSASNCHWVRGYTRKNGTRVRGHTRCK